MISAILLAGGKGKRMHSRLPKVLHKIADRPLLYYSLKLLSHLRINDIQVVIGYHKDIVKREAVAIAQELSVASRIYFSAQKKMLGTGDAVRTALEHIDGTEDVLVLYGDDSFMYKVSTINDVLNLHKNSRADITFITLIVKNPGGMGRIIRDKTGKVLQIVEEKAATPAQLKIREINDGCYVFKASWLRKFINRIPLNAVGEYYLTDLVEIGAKNGASIETYKLGDASEWFGVNTKEQLAQANAIMNSRRKIH